MVKGFNSFKEWFEGYENQYWILRILFLLKLKHG